MNQHIVAHFPLKTQTLKTSVSFGNLVAVALFILCIFSKQNLSGQDDSTGQSGPKDLAALIQLSASESLPFNQRIKYAQLAVANAQESNDLAAEASSQKQLGDLLMANEQYSNAIQPIQNAIQLYGSIRDSLAMADCMNTLGRIENYLGNRDDALVHHVAALSIFENLKDSIQLANSLNSIGGIHYNQNNFEKAYEYFFESLQLREEIGDSLGKAGSFNNIGELHRLNGEFTLAKDYFIKALALNLELDNKAWMAINCNNPGTVHTQEGDLKTAQMYIEQGLSYNIEIEDHEGIATSHNGLGRLFLSMNKPIEALQSFEKAHKEAQSVQSLFQQQSAHQGMSMAYETIGRFEESLQAYKAYHQITDSIFTARKEALIAETQTRFELEQKEKELALKKVELASLARNQQYETFTIYALVLGLVLTVLAGFLVFRFQGKSIRKERIEYLDHEANVDSEKRQLLEKLRATIEQADLKDESLQNAKRELRFFREILIALSGEIKSIEQLQGDSSVRITSIIEGAIAMIENANAQALVSNERSAFDISISGHFPNLSFPEREICLLTKLDLSREQIALVAGISHSELKHELQQIVQKLGLKRETELFPFLSNFDISEQVQRIN